MKKMNPIRLNGKWKQGYALDVHTLSSEYIGENEFGRPLYNTIRSDMGELIYRLKYKKEDTISEIMEIVIPFLKKWGIIDKIDLIIPIPPSNQRSKQPVFEICNAIGECFNVKVSYDILKKNTKQQVKGLDLVEKRRTLESSIICNGNIGGDVSVLLIDDLYESGATLTTATNVLRRKHNVESIYVLTMTKTKN